MNTPRRLLSLLVFFALFGHLSPLAPRAGEQPVVFTGGEILMFEEDRVALQESLKRSIFRAEASQLPPEPYQQIPMVYDGAVAAIDHNGLAFVSSAAWLSGAQEITLLYNEERLPLTVERVDHRFDLALLRLNTERPEITPLPIATQSPTLGYALLSPSTKYEALTSVEVLAMSGKASLYWTTSLAAANGYPLVSSKGALVALHAKRSEDEPSSEGWAIGWPVLNGFLDPPEALPDYRAPDHVLTEWHE